MKKCVIFDLDGTLLYTLDSITHHLNATLSSRGFKKVSSEETGEFIGNGAKMLVSRAMAKSGVSDAETVESVLRDYNLSYNNDPLPFTEPYDGIVELIDELADRDIALAVVTNKPEPTAKQLVEHFFPGKFDVVIGGRAGASLKPDPTDALRAVSIMGGSPSATAFVGDMSVDIQTGRNMGAALSVGVSWGFRSRDHLISEGADSVVDEPLEILPLADKL